MATSFATNPNLRLLLEKDPDHIWAMADESGKIMLAFDCGDAGFVPLTIEQAQQVIDSLQTVMKQLKLIPAPGPEDHPPIGKKETDGLN